MTQDQTQRTRSTVTVRDALQRARDLLTQGRIDTAEALIRAVIDKRPNDISAQQLLAAVAERRGNPAGAIELLRGALTGGGSDALTQLNLCRLLRIQGDLEDSRHAGERAVALGGSPETYVGLAATLTALGENRSALELLERAVAKRPDSARAHLDLAHMLLMTGEFTAGWTEYEWRYRLPGNERLLPQFKQPQWNGMPLRSSRLLVVCEQGYGDCFQYARYLPMVAERVADVIVGVSAPLKPLFERIDGPRVYYDRWETLPDFDFQITLSSLPCVFGTTLETIPASMPYLTADPVKIEAWRSRIEEFARGRRTVGLVWQGRSDHPGDQTRSLALESLTPLLELEEICPVSLQVGDGLEQLESHRAKDRIFNADANFDETAALINVLDCVVSIDSAVAHLTGALGVKGLVMLPKIAEWRWLERRSDSPWYPTLRLVRQRERGDWDEVVANVVRELGDLSLN